MAILRRGVKEGMLVQSTTGEKLGRVIRCDEESFIVEKGLFFPRDHELRYEYVSDIDGDNISYRLEEARAPMAAERAWQERKETKERAFAATATPPKPAEPLLTKAAAPLKREEREMNREMSKEEYKMRLLEEQLDVEKVNRQVGTVRIHKEVITEEKRLTVPVTREEVIVERFAGKKTEPAAGEITFREETIDVPLHEEELRVSKHPVVREEVRVRKVAREEERVASANLRHEEAEIEDSTHHSVAKGTEAEKRMGPGFGDEYKKT
jgi:uncharacterized protein (TIGR02271 family)